MDRDSYVYKTPASKLVPGGCDCGGIQRQTGYADDSDHPGAEGCVGIFQGGGVSHRQGDGIPMNKVYSFITFYAMLSVKPRGRYIVRMCKSAPCHVHGAQAVVQALEDQLGISIGETTEDGRFTLEYCPCLGLCEISPAIMINEHVYGNLTPESVRVLSNNIYGRM